MSSGYTREIPAAQAVQLPTPSGASTILVVNQDSTYTVDLAPTNEFVAGQTYTLAAGAPANWPGGQPLWCRVTPGQTGSPSSVLVWAQPDGSAAPLPRVNATIDPGTEPINITGTVDIAGTPAVTIDTTSAPVEVSVQGTVSIGGTPAVTISGTPTVAISAGQVVQVTNPTGTVLAVNGSVNVSSGTVDINSGQVNVSALAGESLLGTMAAGTSEVTVTPAAGTPGLFILSPQDADATPAYISVIGVTTGLVYPCVRVPQAIFNLSGQPQPGAAWVADISTGSDTSFKVTWETLSPSTTPQPVYVFNDNFRTLVLDGILASTLRDTGSSLNPAKYLIAGGVNSANNPMPIRLTIDDGANGIGGRVWTVPTIPPTETGDHPSVEASIASVSVGVGTYTVLAAPSSGDRIRLLGMTVQAPGSSQAALGPLVSGSVNPVWMSFLGPGTVMAPLPAQGVPLPAATALGLTTSVAGCVVTVVYTIEQV